MFSEVLLNQIFVGTTYFMNFENYLDFMRENFKQRKAINSSYSLRAYARHLEMAPSTLSQVLNMKKGISDKTAKRLSILLKLNEDETEWFLTSVNAKHAKSHTAREAYQDKLESIRQSRGYNEISNEYFKVISNWCHYAILELTHLQNFIYDKNWIASALDLEVSIVETAIQRLIKLELATEMDGTLVDSFHDLATVSDLPSASLRSFNLALMKKAQFALEDTSVESREISSNIISIAKSDIPELKKRIRKFRRNIDKDLNNQKDDVYCLSIQLFSLLREKK